MTTKRQDQSLPATVHPTLADVALLDVKEVVAAVGHRKSWVHAEVRAKRFPQPLRFGMRCTRWKAADIRRWLEDQVARAESDTAVAEKLVARATKASLKGGAPEARAKSVATRKARAARDVVVVAPVSKVDATPAPQVPTHKVSAGGTAAAAAAAAAAEVWEKARAAHKARMAASRVDQQGR